MVLPFRTFTRLTILYSRDLKYGAETLWVFPLCVVWKADVKHFLSSGAEHKGEDVRQGKKRCEHDCKQEGLIFFLNTEVFYFYFYYD